MNCQVVQNSLSAHLDGCTAGEERQRISLHLARCEDCTRHAEQLRQVSRALRQLPRAVPTEDLSLRLRIAASRDRARRLRRRQFGLAGAAAYCWQWTGQLMRPLALPFAGGLASAIVLFGLLVPNVYMRSVSGPNDAPTAFYTQATVKALAPFGFREDEFVVEVMVDEQGRMTDYTITQGPSLVKDAQLRRSVENNLLFTEFTPATVFGQPMPGKLFLSFSHRRINIKS